MTLAAIIKNSKSEYLKNPETMEFSISSADAFEFDLTDSDVLDTITDVAAELILGLKEPQIFVDIIDKSSSKILATLTVKESGVMASVGITTPPEIKDLVKIMATVIMGGLSSAGVTSSMKSIKAGVGAGSTSPITGSMPSSSASEDEIVAKIEEFTKAEIVKPKETLDDYVSDSDLKDELVEISSFFNDRAIYTSRGVEVPKGVLFKGPPGTGKTYAARCIAGSTNCYFMSTTASALQGIYIGSGAENIRKLFKGAKMLYEELHKGVIIFIDELDSLGSRTKHNGGAGGEEDRTLNQLLAELSGFTPTDNIMLLAATNFVERLDDALMRSGRLGRQITINYPNDAERYALVSYYFKKFPLDGTDFAEISQLTVGCTPADIKMISNEAAILSIRMKQDKIHLEHVNEAINKVLTKNVKNHNSKIPVELVAAHESGHVLTESLIKDSVPIKVTCESYGEMGGFTQVSKRLEGMRKKEDFINEVKSLLGGRAAEQVYCGYITSGASSDLERARHVIRVYYESLNFENYQAEKLNQIVLDKLDELYKETVEFMKSNKGYLDTLTKTLIAKKTIYAVEINGILGTAKGGPLAC